MTRAAGNLLIVWWNNQGNNAIPATPAGWSIATSAIASGSFNSSGIFYKIAAGGDAAPAITDSRLYVVAAEFSGNAASTPLDQTGSASSLAASPFVATAGGTDAQNGDLVVYVTSAHYAVAPGGNQFSPGTLNNGSVTQAALWNTSADQGAYGYGVTTGNASADSISIAVAGSFLGGCVSIASFLPGAAAGSMFLVMGT